MARLALLGQAPWLFHHLRNRWLDDGSAAGAYGERVTRQYGRVGRAVERMSKRGARVAIRSRVPWVARELLTQGWMLLAFGICGLLAGIFYVANPEAPAERLVGGPVYFRVLGAAGAISGLVMVAHAVATLAQASRLLPMLVLDRKGDDLRLRVCTLPGGRLSITVSPGHRLEYVVRQHGLGAEFRWLKLREAQSPHRRLYLRLPDEAVDEVVVQLARACGERGISVARVDGAAKAA
ncbi:hypothetical protein [Demequina mangrovi]|uniref:hypothetical protein n=1 Tax=Demequina mangrovi TaxID=1043493 RepID=UPI00116005FF|nr:hypothetical protein [Demequina mangrovi]